MPGHTLRTWLSFVNREQRIGQAILWSMLGCSFLLFAFPAHSNLPYGLDGEIVQGKVLTSPVEVSNPPKFGPKYTVRFEYSDAVGNVYQGAGLVRSSDCKPGDPIPVRYVRTDPSRSRLESNVREIMPSFLFASLGLVIVVASVWHGIAGVRRVNNQVRSHLRLTDADSIANSAEPSHAPEPAAGPVSNGESSPPAR